MVGDNGQSLGKFQDPASTIEQVFNKLYHPVRARPECVYNGLIITIRIDKDNTSRDRTVAIPALKTTLSHTLGEWQFDKTYIAKVTTEMSSLHTRGILQLKCFG